MLEESPEERPRSNWIVKGFVSSIAGLLVAAGLCGANSYLRGGEGFDLINGIGVYVGLASFLGLIVFAVAGMVVAIANRSSR